MGHDQADEGSDPERVPDPHQERTAEHERSVHPEDAMPLAELDAHARAEAALRRIAAGSDPGREAFDLANTLNDETVARVRARLTRWFRRH
ncbi:MULTISPECIES: hypothetical protein [unclassified Curtobacterium]|uniref:hypothetical protein n=1 Tax=unclassified Curtobacterium TaxID=257496 RepID=UPI000DAA8CC1|nr:MULTISPECIES: hypothetical protein [unclassified Curtobacterium]PZE25727.1 hypothetical protein DEI86_10605 [Curtobacterium sp. MCBD17_028]PZF62558.1 hypothetical protein DEI92_03550 [Curtobacterium sp. MCBD17_034]PZM39735.1 hypothetical protein DEI90_02560 [Curtobacterium sp. MCBD17_031]